MRPDQRPNNLSRLNADQVLRCTTGQRKLCFNRCQLIITLMSSIKEGRYKPRLYFPISSTMAAILRDSVVVVRTRPRAIPLAIMNN